MPLRKADKSVVRMEYLSQQPRNNCGTETYAYFAQRMTGAFDNRSKSNLESISLTITKAIKLDMSIKNMEAPTHAQFVFLKNKRGCNQKLGQA